MQKNATTRKATDPSTLLLAPSKRVCPYRSPTRAPVASANVSTRIGMQNNKADRPRDSAKTIATEIGK